LDSPSILAYASTKGALRLLSRTGLPFLAPRYPVNAVSPGVIDTDMSNFTRTEAGREAALGMQALKRIGKPEDVADVTRSWPRTRRAGSPVPVSCGWWIKALEETDIAMNRTVESKNKALVLEAFDTLFKQA